MPDEEAKWRAEFERTGEAKIRGLISLRAIYDGEPKKQQFALRWLCEKDEARRTRDDKIYCYTRLTLWAAIVAAVAAVGGVIVSVIGIWLH